MFQKTIKHTCERKIHQCGEMQILPLSEFLSCSQGDGVGGAWLPVLALFLLILGWMQDAELKRAP